MNWIFLSIDTSVSDLSYKKPFQVHDKKPKY